VTTDGPASDEAEVTDEEVSTLMQEAERKSLDVHGDIPGLVSTFEEFYNVDIAEFDPDLSADGWSLTVTGEVGTDVTVTFDELTDMPTERRFVTLRCGREPERAQTGQRRLDGDADQAATGGSRSRGECRCAMLHAADDYFVQFPIEALEDGFLAWG